MGPYEFAARRLTLPARAIDQTIDPNFQDLSLRQAVDRLGAMADVVICYPYGQFDETDIDPNRTVSLRGEMTLGAALASIDEQLELPVMDWASCQGLAGAIFPTSGVDFFPTELGESARLGPAELSQDPTLGQAQIRERRLSLAMVAFSAEEFSERDPNARVAAIRVGADGPPMVVYDPDGSRVSGALIWRLMQAVPSHVPEEMTGQIREQVAHDWKILRAFELARQRAEAIAVDAGERGLDVAAEAAGYDPNEVGPLPRIQVAQPRLAVAQQLMLRGASQEQAGMYAQDYPPVEFRVSTIPGIALPNSGAIWQSVLDEIFELAPEDPNADYTALPYAQRTRVLAFPLSQAVYIVQGVEYGPLNRDAYVDGARIELASMLLSERRWTAMINWFMVDNVRQRIGLERQQ